MQVGISKKRVTSAERRKAMDKLWKQFPEAKLGWCSSHWHYSGHFVAATCSFSNPDLDGNYIWFDKNIEVAKIGKEENGCIEGYP